MYTIDQEWRIFMKDVTPEDAATKTAHNMRCAFYAGASALDNLFCQMAEAHQGGTLPKSPTDMLNDIRKEIADFFDMVEATQGGKLQ